VKVTALLLLLSGLLAGMKLVFEFRNVSNRRYQVQSHLFSMELLKNTWFGEGIDVHFDFDDGFDCSTLDLTVLHSGVFATSEGCDEDILCKMRSLLRHPYGKSGIGCGSKDFKTTTYLSIVVGLSYAS